MRYIKRILRLFALGLMVFSLIGCGDKNIASTFTSLTTGNIEKIEVSSPKKQVTKSLNSDEALSLVKLLNNISINDVKEYNGPIIKGGPTIVAISTKLNETVKIILDGDHFIYRKGNKDYEVYQPDVRKLINEVIA